jgi:hypothetical protein
MGTAGPTVDFHPKGSGEDTSIVRTTTTFKNRVGRWESRRDAVVTNVSFPLRIKMGPVLATEGELRQTATSTAS